MGSQKIVNLLNDSDNASSKHTTKKRYVINDEIILNTVKEMKMVQLLNLKPKLLNEVFVIIQFHIFL